MAGVSSVRGVRFPPPSSDAKNSDAKDSDAKEFHHPSFSSGLGKPPKVLLPLLGGITNSRNAGRWKTRAALMEKISRFLFFVFSGRRGRHTYTPRRHADVRGERLRSPPPRPPREPNDRTRHAEHAQPRSCFQLGSPAPHPLPPPTPRIGRLSTGRVTA